MLKSLPLIAALVAVPVTALASQQAMVELLRRCAPNVALDTMSSIVRVESKGNALAIADAGPKNLPWRIRKKMVRSFYPATQAEAVNVVKTLLAQGHTVSIGLSQINDRNLPSLGLTVEEVLDPCKNVAAGADILNRFYARATAQFGPGQKALMAAISAYNSGDWYRGAADGYVAQVVASVGQIPALKVGRPAGSTPAKSNGVPALLATANPVANTPARAVDTVLVKNRAVKPDFYMRVEDTETGKVTVTGRHRSRASLVAAAKAAPLEVHFE
ncbi:lytic transglycosylase domain-containing protein [Chromobacterium vaccinii]|uniref:lytic transglycosylase domain-containing protein n=1 Tax=Chromobacterium vaccinii TaxID=1108595 RepID=UPI003C791B5D